MPNPLSLDPEIQPPITPPFSLQSFFVVSKVATILFDGATTSSNGGMALAFILVFLLAVCYELLK